MGKQMNALHIENERKFCKNINACKINLFFCIGFAWPGFFGAGGYRDGFCKTLPEAFPVLAHPVPGASKDKYAVG